MNRILTTACAALLALGLTLQDAEAKRLGGGASRGLQRDSVTQRQATPPQAPSSPAQQAAPQAAPQQPGAAPVSQPQRRSWLGPIAGLAAGLGLAALFSHLGLGEGLASFVMILLLALAAFFVFRLLFRRGRPQAAPGSFGYAGAGHPGTASSHGNRFQSASPAGIAASTSPAQPDAPAAAASVPPGFDVEGFLRVAKVNFLRLQAANDSGNLADIREFTTPEMFAEIKLDLDDRRGATQHTDVLDLAADLLEVVTEDSRHIASVRFHGRVQEERGAQPVPFDEVWNLVKPADGSRGWLVAGIQQLN